MSAIRLERQFLWIAAGYLAVVHHISRALRCCSPATRCSSHNARGAPPRV